MVCYLKNRFFHSYYLIFFSLADIFVQNDASGRLPYSTVPNILQRFGIALTEGDLSSAANDLAYNSKIYSFRFLHTKESCFL